MAKGKQTFFGMYCQAERDSEKCGFQSKTISRNKASIPQGEKLRETYYCKMCQAPTVHLAKPEKK